MRVKRHLYVSSPGETIRQEMCLYGRIGYSELAKKLGITVKKLHKLIDGKIRLTEDVAEKLETVFDVPVEFWLNRDSNYWLDVEGKFKIPGIYEGVQNDAEEAYDAERNQEVERWRTQEYGHHL